MFSEDGEHKSTSISTAKRLGEFLGEDVIKDKGRCCRFIIGNVPRDVPLTERGSIILVTNGFACPTLISWIFARFSIAMMTSIGSTVGRRRFISIPAALQNITNPLVRVSHPDWLHKRLWEKNNLSKPKRITDQFNSIDHQTHIDHNEQQLTVNEVNEHDQEEDVQTKAKRSA